MRTPFGQVSKELTIEGRVALARFNLAGERRAPSACPPRLRRRRRRAVTFVRPSDAHPPHRETLVERGLLLRKGGPFFAFPLSPSRNKFVFLTLWLDRSIEIQDTLTFNSWNECETRRQKNQKSEDVRKKSSSVHKIQLNVHY